MSQPKKNHIKIEDWTGKVLFQGHYKSKEVDRVLDANRCTSCKKSNVNENCEECNGSGYWGDFEISWLDSSNETNVYECINY